MHAADAKPLTPAQQQFGNQNAVGNKGGRDRTVSFSEEEMIILGEEMVEWVKLHKPIHLSMWYTQHKDFTDKQWDTFRKCPEFFHYYTKALKLIGYSYLDKDSQVDVRLKDRWQRVYFKDLKESENEDAKFDADLKAAALKSETAAIEQEKNRVMEEVNRNRKTIE
jgi:hypothetical protein